MTESRTIESEILRQVGERGAAKSISPSDVARAMQPDWQSLLSAVRRAAIRLSQEGRIDILRKGKPVPPEDVRGVIRLRLRDAAPDTLAPDASAPGTPAPDAP